MAVLFPHAGLAKLLGSQSIQSDATSIRDLIEEIRRRVGDQDWETNRRVTILVNGVSIHRLDGKDTPLRADDRVWMVLPSGGG